MAARAAQIASMREFFLAHWPSSAELWLTDGAAPQAGDLITNPRYADVLQDLVGVDDVEGVVSEGQRHGVRHLEAGPDVTRVDRRLPRQPHDRLRGVDADDLAGGDPLREVERDRARTAPDVEHPHAGSQVGGEVGR